MSDVSKEHPKTDQKRATLEKRAYEILERAESSILQNISLSASAIIVTGTEKGTKINTKCSPEHPPTPNMSVQRGLCRGQGLKNEVGGVGTPVRFSKGLQKAAQRPPRRAKKGTQNRHLENIVCDDARKPIQVTKNVQIRLRNGPNPQCSSLHRPTPNAVRKEV